MLSKENLLEKIKINKKKIRLHINQTTPSKITNSERKKKSLHKKKKKLRKKNLIIKIKKKLY